VLDPRATWADKDSYDVQARNLARMFGENFQQFADQVPPEVRAGGPSPR
jgi:phosphoenolpyruvate carboxykinase (ATP)